MRTFQQLFWVSYRKGFPAIGDSGLTSDSGWGCMIRTGQMAVAHALQRQLLGEAWREGYETGNVIRKRIAYWLSDSPHHGSMLSIHALTAAGLRRGTQIGQWFGPNDVCYAIRDVVNSAPNLNGLLRVAVFNNGVLYSETVHSLCAPLVLSSCTSTPTLTTTSTDAVSSFSHSHTTSTITTSATTTVTTTSTSTVTESVDTVSTPTVPSQQQQHAEWQSAALILVVLRLGLDRLNEEYTPQLAKMLQDIPQCIGYLGGTPRHSIYCVGCRGSDMVYLDPHTTQHAWRPTKSSSQSSPVTAHSPVCPCKCSTSATNVTTTATTSSCECKCEHTCSCRCGDAEKQWSDTVPGLGSPPDMPATYLNSFSCKNPLFAKITKLDPSLAVAFHCRNRVEFEDLCEKLSALLGEFETPMFSIGKFEPRYAEDGGVVEGKCATDALDDGPDLLLDGGPDVLWDGGEDGLVTPPSSHRSSAMRREGGDGGVVEVEQPYVYCEDDDEDDFVMIHSTTLTSETNG